MPDISIIIPTFNRAAIIGKTLDSVIDQTYSNYEIVIIDDGSTDETESVVMEYKNGINGDKIRYVKQENAGCASARNHGIKVAKGRYICFIDSDDCFVPQSLELRMKALNQYDVDYMVGNPRIITSEKDTDGYIRKFLPGCAEVVSENVGSSYLCDAKAYQRIIIERGIFGVIGSMTFSKELLERVGLFDEGLSHAEDVDLWYKVCFEIDKFIYLDEILSVYNYFDQDSEGHKSKNLAKHFAAERKRYLRFIKRLNRRGIDPSLVKIAKRRICGRKYKVKGILLYREGKNLSALKCFLKSRAIFKGDKSLNMLIAKSFVPYALRKLFKR